MAAPKLEPEAAAIATLRAYVGEDLHQFTSRGATEKRKAENVQAERTRALAAVAVLENLLADRNRVIIPFEGEVS